MAMSRQTLSALWHPEADFTLWSTPCGAIRLNGLVAVCRVQMMWYASSLLLGVARDAQHRFLALIDDRVLVKPRMPLRSTVSAMDTTPCCCCGDRLSVGTRLMFRLGMGAPRRCRLVAAALVPRGRTLCGRVRDGGRTW